MDLAHHGVSLARARLTVGEHAAVIAFQGLGDDVTGNAVVDLDLRHVYVEAGIKVEKVPAVWSQDFKSEL